MLSLSITGRPGGTYRAYVVPESTSFGGPIHYADSTDGVVFGATTPIGTVTPDTRNSFDNPAVLGFETGGALLVFDRIRQSSAGVVIFNLLRTESPNGITFTENPDSIFIPSGSSFLSAFTPSIARTSPEQIRLYFTNNSNSGEFASALSSDNGASWTEEGEVAILGTSSSYAYLPAAPVVIADPRGGFLMFFASPPSEGLDARIYSAESSDGRNFTVHDQPVLAPSPGSSVSNPEAIALPDGSIRLYWVERSGALGAFTFTVRSAVAAP